MAAPVTIGPDTRGQVVGALPSSGDILWAAPAVLTISSADASIASDGRYLRPGAANALLHGLSNIPRVLLITYAVEPFCKSMRTLEASPPGTERPRIGAHAIRPQSVPTNPGRHADLGPEVKALAVQMAKATEEIEKQIQGMQLATSEPVGAIKDVGATIVQISTIAEEIATAVRAQDAMTSGIADNVEQAANGTTKVAAQHCQGEPRRC